jgi:uncharacterized protein YdaU (DUF1376 family)
MANGDLPYFPLYVKDFATSGRVEAMTTAEVGAYMLLLCKAWLETPPATIPDDDKILARWARLNPAEWSECKQAVLSCFKASGDGRLVQPRLRAEYDKIRRRKNANSENGSKGGRPPKPKVNQNESDGLTNPYGSVSGSDSSGSEPREGALVSWLQVAGLHTLYPKHRRGSPGGFLRAVEPAWDVLLARGDTQPYDTLASILGRYVRSWAATHDKGFACVGAEKFFAADGVWTQDPADWGEPREVAASAAPQPVRGGRL